MPATAIARLSRRAALLALPSLAAACRPAIQAGPAFFLDHDAWRPLHAEEPLADIAEPPLLDAFHAAHAGEIVFTAKDLVPDTPLAEADLRRAFDLGSRLSVRAYFREPVGSAMRRAGITCTDEASVAVGPASPIRGTVRHWDTVPIPHAAREWTAREQLYGIPTDVPTKRARPEDPPTLSFWASAALSAMHEGRNELALVLLARCGGYRGTAYRTYGVIVARGSLRIDLAPGALARYRAAFGPKLPEDLYPEMQKVVASLLAARGERPSALVFPRVWSTHVFRDWRPWVRSLALAAVRRRADGLCEIVLGSVYEKADTAYSTHWLPETTDVALADTPELVIACDIVESAPR